MSAPPTAIRASAPTPNTPSPFPRSAACTPLPIPGDSSPPERIAPFWLRTPAGRLAEALPGLRRVVAEAENVIVESNSVLGLLKPDRCLMVLDGAVPDFKSTSLRFLDRAHMLVATSAAPFSWPDVPASLLKSKPLCLAPAPSYESADLYASLKTQL